MRLEDARVGMKVRVSTPDVPRHLLGEPDEGTVIAVDAQDELYPVCVEIDGYPEWFRPDGLEPAEV